MQIFLFASAKNIATRTNILAGGHEDEIRMGILKSTRAYIRLPVIIIRDRKQKTKAPNGFDFLQCPS